MSTRRTSGEQRRRPLQGKQSRLTDWHNWHHGLLLPRLCFAMVCSMHKLDEYHGAPSGIFQVCASIPTMSPLPNRALTPFPLIFTLVVSAAV